MQHLFVTAGNICLLLQGKERGRERESCRTRRERAREEEEEEEEEVLLTAYNK